MKTAVLSILLLLTIHQGMFLSLLNKYTYTYTVYECVKNVDFSDPTGNNGSHLGQTDLFSYHKLII